MSETHRSSDPTRYLHCAACMDSGRPDRIAVYVDGKALTVLCESHEEHMLVVRLTPAEFAPFLRQLAGAPCPCCGEA